MDKSAKQGDLRARGYYKNLGAPDLVPHGPQAMPTSDRQVISREPCGCLAFGKPYHSGKPKPWS